MQKAAPLRSLRRRLDDAGAGHGPTATRSSLGNGGTTVFWDAARRGLIRERALHLTFGEFSQKFAKVTKRRAVPAATRSSSRPTPATRPSRPATPAPTSSRGPTTRPRPARWSPCSGRPATRSSSSTRRRAPAACRSTSRRPTPTTSRRRSRFAADGGLWLALLSPAAIERIEELAALRPLDPRVALADHRAGELAQGPDLQHARAWRRSSCSPTSSSGCSASGGLDGCVARTRANSVHLYGWAEASAFATPFVADPAKRSLVVGTIDFADEVDAAAVAATLRANGIVDTEPYRKLGRNQLRIGMFPAIELADVEALTACIDYVVDGWRRDARPGRREHRRLAASICCASTSTSTRATHLEPHRRLRRHPHPLGDEAHRRRHRPRDEPEGHRPRRRGRRQRRRRRPRPSAASSSPTRRSPTSSPPPSTPWRCCSRWPATSPRPTPA